MQHAEQIVGLFRCQHTGGFVEDQGIGAAIQRLEDLDALLLADRDVLHDGIGVDGQAVFVGKALQLPARLAQ